MKKKHICHMLSVLTQSLFLGLFLFAGLTQTEQGWASEAGAAATANNNKADLKAELWQEAVAASKEGNLEKASVLYQRYHEKFRDTEKAEEALWQAARNLKQLAMRSPTPQWGKVRDIFRRYGADYPKSKRSDEAYFEVGYAHYRMRFYREALTYFKLFLKRYPSSPFREQVRLVQADTLLAVRRVAEALEIFKDVSESGNDEIKPHALMSMGEIIASGKEPAEALKIFAAIFEKYPDYHYQNPELLRKLGFVYLRLGREEDARSNLFHYLNLAGKPADWGEVLFELGESYLREGDGKTALKLYERILEDGARGDRIAVLSRFRRAEYMYSPDVRMVKGQPASDLADPEGDKPILAVIKGYPDEPIAQDARRAMFLRYQARNNGEAAVDTAWSYLRYNKPGLASGEKDAFIGTLLLYLGERFLAKKAYDKLYQLYVSQYRHVNSLEGGRFQYLVGQALEALSLLEQASVVYYRAQGKSLSDEDKADLYSRRIQVYLLQKNLAAADRVLRYVRNIYRDTEYLGEFYYLTGKFYEVQGKKKETLAWYVKATEASPVPKKIKVYIDARLRMLDTLALYPEGFALLSQARQKQWLEPEALQVWYREVGDGLASQGSVAALDAYLAGVDQDMPKESKAAQQIHLKLGDIFRKDKDMDSARGHLLKAQAGPDALLKKKAKNLLNQIEIDLKRKPRKVVK